MHLQGKCLLKRQGEMHCTKTLHFVIMEEKTGAIKLLEDLKVLPKILDNGTGVMIKACVWCQISWKACCASNFRHTFTFILHFSQTCLSKLCVLLPLSDGFNLKVADKNWIESLLKQ